jgi:prophage antirepressor-like protein
MSLQRFGTSMDVLIDSLTDQNGKVVDIEDEPWFEARPFALFLGYTNAKQAIQLNIDADCFRGVVGGTTSF